MHWLQMSERKLKDAALGCFLFLGIFLLVLPNSSFSRDSELNVLLITVDTLRADYLGCYGNRKVETPGLDTLARKGILFKRAFAHNVVTLPSHTNIMTGTYPVFHGVRDDIGFRLEEGFDTLAEILKKEGYETAAFIGAFVLDSRFGLDQGFDLYDDFYGGGKGMYEFSMVERQAEEVVSPALEWLRSHQESRWFCWVHLFDPHIPYRPPQPFSDKYKGDPYAGEVAYADHWIGKLIDYIKDKDLEKMTLIVVTADHGESLGEHKERTHGIFAYNSTLHIPLIFSQPRIFSKPKTIQHRVRHIDILPTILEILKIKVPHNVQGRSLLGLVKEPKKWREDDSYFEALTAHLNSNWAPLQGLLSGSFKYIDLPIREIYDERSDLEEKNNLAEARESLVRKLDGKLNDLLDKYSQVSSPNERRRSEDLETLRKLESLGYVAGGSLKVRQREYTEKDDPKRLIGLHNRMLDAIDGYYDEGKAEEAISIFNEILRQRPSFSRVYSHLAYVYHQQGQIVEAIETLEKALSHGIEYGSLQYKLGIYYQEAKRYKESSEILETLVERFPENLDAYNYLGVSYWRMGNPEKAVETFKKLLARDGSHASAHNNLGSVYLSQERYDLAMAQFKLALQYAPRMAAAHNGLGVACASQKDDDKALYHWQRAVELDIHQYDALYNLSILLVKKGKPEKALRYINLFIENAPAKQYKKDVERMKELRARIKSKSHRESK